MAIGTPSTGCLALGEPKREEAPPAKITAWTATQQP